MSFSFPIYKMGTIVPFSMIVIRIRGKAFKVAHRRCFVNFTCCRLVFREKDFVGHTALCASDGCNLGQQREKSVRRHPSINWASHFCWFPWKFIRISFHKKMNQELRFSGRKVPIMFNFNCRYSWQIMLKVIVLFILLLSVLGKGPVHSLDNLFCRNVLPDI